jgi:bacitracin transport system permease protein
MRKNIKHYYLYFFALIFSASLYFVFASLRYGQSTMQTPFKVASILLCVIVIVFTGFANRIFLKRRSREIGLYQLIGLTKLGTVRLLIIENVLLGAGALLVGILCGSLVSRLFLLILIKLLGSDVVQGISFSIEAALQTALLFGGIIILTSVQMLLTVYRSTLLDLFHADQQGENPKQPKTIVSAFLALLGLGLIGFGYYLSGHMLNKMLLLNMLAVLGSTILGTYLLFRVTISWFLFRYRKGKRGHLGLKNSLSLAPLMHRMKANANSLTLITVLSAMTMTMIAIAYSLYYSVENDTRSSLPYDYVFENKRKDAEAFEAELKKANIKFTHGGIDALVLKGSINERDHGGSVSAYTLIFLPAEQLKQTGRAIPVPMDGSAEMYDARFKLNNQLDQNTLKLPTEIAWEKGQALPPVKLTRVSERNAMNYSVQGMQFVVSEKTFHELQGEIDSKSEKEYIDTYQVPSKDDRIQASAMYAKYVPKGAFMPDYQTEFEASFQVAGVFIFIAGFLGLVFLISTGSILYFKQMTEAEQEKKSYTILRQLGFEEKEILRGIIRKQLFVFAIPLGIGLLHSVFAVKAASILLISDIMVPTVIAMAVYALIYFIFAILSIGYYRKMVRAAL